MPDRTYIAKDEKTQSRYKAAKDRVTLLLGGNASGNCKLTPLFIHRSEYLRTLKNVPKESLPVIYKWNSNPKPTQNQYLIRNRMAKKVSLGKKLDLPLDEIDIHELVSSYAE